jgi:hypothetical protein
MRQQENRLMRPSRHHRSSIGHSSSSSSSGRSSRTTSPNANNNVDRRRDDLIQRGIDIPSSSISSSTIRHHPQLHDQNFLYSNNENNIPSFHPMPRLSAWHTRRGSNWLNDSQQSQLSSSSTQRSDRRSSFVDDFYSASEIPHQYESDDHLSRTILSPIPRRYDARFVATLASLPIGNEHDLLGTNNNNNNRSNVDGVSNNNDSVRTTEQRGSASGEVC